METVRTAYPLSPVVRQAVLRAYNHKCQYCHGEHGVAEHVDHIYPKSRGGEDDLRNYIAACGPCNTRKHARLFSDLWLRMAWEIAENKLEEILAHIQRSKKPKSIPTLSAENKTSKKVHISKPYEPTLCINRQVTPLMVSMYDFMWKRRKVHEEDPAALKFQVTEDEAEAILADLDREVGINSEGLHEILDKIMGFHMAVTMPTYRWYARITDSVSLTTSYPTEGEPLVSNVGIRLLEMRLFFARPLTQLVECVGIEALAELPPYTKLPLNMRQVEALQAIYDGWKYHPR